MTLEVRNSNELWLTKGTKIPFFNNKNNAYSNGGWTDSSKYTYITLAEDFRLFPMENIEDADFSPHPVFNEMEMTYNGLYYSALVDEGTNADMFFTITVVDWYGDGRNDLIIEFQRTDAIDGTNLGGNNGIIVPDEWNSTYDINNYHLENYPKCYASIRCTGEGFCTNEGYQGDSAKFDSIEILANAFEGGESSTEPNEPNDEPARTYPNTLIEKLEYMKVSKSDIKDAIIEKGGVVNDSTPLKDYAQAIRDIESNKPAIVSHYQPETKARDVVIGNMQTHIKAKLQGTMNFDITGKLNNDDGIFNGFGYYNYINNVYYTTEQDVVLRFKVRTTTRFTTQNIAHCENAYNFAIENDYFRAYSWSASRSFTSNIEIPTDTWLYLTLKFTNQGSNVLKQYYYSLDGFTTDDSNKLFEFEDNLYTGGTNNYGGCIGVSSYNRSNPFVGRIDMNETNVVDHDGNIIREYFTAGRELYSE